MKKLTHMLTLDRENNGDIAYQSLWYSKLFQPDPLIAEPEVLDEWSKTELFAIIEAASRVVNEDDFRYLIRHQVRRIIPHQAMICGINQRNSRQYAEDYLNIGFSADFLSIIDDINSGLTKAIAPAWEKKPTTYVLNNIEKTRFLGQRWLVAARRHAISNLLIDGFADLADQKVSYFCFAQCPERFSKKHRYSLELLTPSLHAALLRVLARKQKTRKYQCGTTESHTAREQELLILISHGHTNMDIAEKFAISTNTVRNHVQNILEKLQANNRAHAVATAYRLGLLVNR